LAIWTTVAVAIDDPIAYWDFEDQSDMLVNRVISGPYHDARVLAGQPAVGLWPEAPGLAGNALVLDGDDALRLPQHQDMLGESFTIACWYWQATNDTRMCVFSTRHNYSVEYGGALGDNYSTFANWVGEQNAGSVTMGLKTWIHVAHVFSTQNGQTTLTAYTNGAFAVTRTLNGAYIFVARPVNGLHVGAHRLPANRYLKGMIDELALWDRALNADEVALVFQRGQAGQPLVYKTRSSSAIVLSGRQYSLSLDTDNGIPGAGVAYNGWLMYPVEPPLRPFIIPDTADYLGAHALAVNGKRYIRDTSGHPDGPFHAEMTDLKYRIPLNHTLKSLAMDDFSFEAWYRSTTTNRGTLIGNYVGSSTPAINLELATNPIRVRFFIQSNISGHPNVDLYSATSGEKGIATNAFDGLWHHVVGVRSNDTVLLYFDGVEVAQGADTAGLFNLGGDYLCLARDNRTSTTVFNGNLGHARVWSRALTREEIALLAASEMPGSSGLSRTGLVAEYAVYDEGFHARRENYGYSYELSPLIRQVTLSNLTAEAWFCTTNSGREVLMGNYAETIRPNLNLELHEQNDGNNVRIHMQNAGSTLNLIRSAGGVTVRDGRWHHLAGVRRDGRALLYLDGALVAGSDVSDTLGAFILAGSYWFLGRDTRAGSQRLDGTLGPTRLWSRALSVDEIQLLAGGARPREGVEPDGLLVEHNICHTNNLTTAGFRGLRFLRSMDNGTNSLMLAFEQLPPHKTIGIGLLLAQLDTLEPVRDNDHFVIRVDGQEVFKVGLGFGTSGPYEEPVVAGLELLGQPADPQLLLDVLTLADNLFYSGDMIRDFDEHVYDLSRLEALQQIPHTRSTLTVELIGYQDQNATGEGFGIDHFQLTLEPLRGTLITLK